MASLLNFILNLDVYLRSIAQSYGSLAYLFLFLIIFAETGLVVFPFLPGDSLLFISGTLAAAGLFNVFILFILVSFAAILGNTVNYWIGYYLEKEISKSRLFNKQYFERAHKFYEKYGGTTIVLTRFVPILRTFAPFVAGVGRMDHGKFQLYNILGGVLWAFIFIFAGYYFGAIPFVKSHLTLISAIIVIVSLIPAVIEFLRHKFRKN